MDHDKTGTINFQDMKWLVARIGLDFTDKDIKEMIREADTKGRGEIEIQDFLKLMQKTKNVSQTSQTKQNVL